MIKIYYNGLRMKEQAVWVVIPNWNGKKFLGDCLRSLSNQTQIHKAAVVDNGSTDGSAAYIKKYFPEVNLIELHKNYGFAGGVNAGVKYALKQGAKYVALFNNDAEADKNWLKNLVKRLGTNNQIGIVTCKFLQPDKGMPKIDSTGDQYSIWGLPFPRGRGQRDHGQFEKPENIFSASGGASLYRAELFKDIGLFDEAFFAYFEDVDLSFRAQLAGWQIVYEPQAVAYHQIGGTSSKLGQFTRYHTIKNFYYLYFKNMPGWLFWKYLPRFIFTANTLELYNLKRRLFRSLFKAYLKVTLTLPIIVFKRWRIQSRRRVTPAHIDSLLYRGIPPTQKSHLRLVSKLRKVFGP